MTERRLVLGKAALAIAMTVPALAGPPATAHDGHTESIEELVVYGRAEERIGIAVSASEGLVGYDDLVLPPLLRVGELVEAVPGMVATQHSGTGKSNQYFLRGFNLDHGTDFAASAEGVPLNMRTHGHGQGYLDLNFLIPELIVTTEFRKGPYAARVGDFSSAGSTSFTFHERLDNTIFTAVVGEHDYYRGLAAGSVDTANGTLMAAVDVTGYAGPWVLDEELRQHKMFGSYAFGIGEASAKITVQGYDGEWKSTDQIPRRAVQSGQIDALGFVDPDLGGDSQRYALTGALEVAGWRFSAYAVDYEMTLFSNFTYFLENPDDGDQFEQRDRRRIYGIDFQAPDWPMGARPLLLRWGGAARSDDIAEVGLYQTVARQRTNTLRQDVVDEKSLGLWGETEMHFNDRLRMVAGLRADYYEWKVNAAQSANSGRGSEETISPKISMAYRLRDSAEAYLNWGHGFHSNDVRGATITVDPGTGEPADAVPVLVDSQGAEVGLRLELGRKFNATLALFRLDLDSELVFVGDAGTTEANDATRRTGIEAATFWQATDWLAVNAAYTFTDARFRLDQGGGREIPGAVGSTFTLGLNAAWNNGLAASVRLRYLGEAPLVEDDSVRAADSMLLNAGINYRREQLEFRFDVFNLLGSDDNDIAYFYTSRLAGEAAGGVEDLHFHPLEPRTARVSMTWHWR